MKKVEHMALLVLSSQVSVLVLLHLLDGGSTVQTTDFLSVGLHYLRLPVFFFIIFFSHVWALCISLGSLHQYLLIVIVPLACHSM